MATIVNIFIIQYVWLRVNDLPFPEYSRSCERGKVHLIHYHAIICQNKKNRSNWRSLVAIAPLQSLLSFLCTWTTAVSFSGIRTHLFCSTYHRWGCAENNFIIKSSFSFWYQFLLILKSYQAIFTVECIGSTVLIHLI